MAPYRAVVFDFDGVLAKSMGLHAEAYRRILAPYDIQPTDRDIFLQEGARSETIIRDALQKADAEFDDDLVGRLADEKQKAFRALEAPSLYDGAEETVRTARALCQHVALVTGTRRANLDRLIPDLLPLFDAVLAQADYTEDKPHPEPYAKAAERLGLPPAQCVVVENAVRGVQSAKSAGYGHVLAVTSTLSEADLADADTIVPDLAAVRSELRRLLEASEAE